MCDCENKEDLKPMAQGEERYKQIKDNVGFLEKNSVPFIAVFFNGEEVVVSSNINNDDIIPATEIAKQKMVLHAGRQLGIF